MACFASSTHLSVFVYACVLIWLEVGGQMTTEERATVGGDRAREKALMARHYRFVLALENSAAPSYVTEKVRTTTHT
jgi:hypothetical protein